MKSTSLRDLTPAKLPTPTPAAAMPPVVNKLSSEPESTKRRPPSREKVLVAFRMTRADKKSLEQLALDLDMTVQDLLHDAIASYRREKGLR